MAGLRLWGVLLIFFSGPAMGQADSTGVDGSHLRHLLRVLAADSMRGRGNYAPELKKAALFIQEQYRQAGLVPYGPNENFLQLFGNRNNSAANLAPPDSSNYDPQQVLANVVGVLPGKGENGEVVIFSAHYDHVGTMAGGRDGIYNGANDNASGTAAMVALAHYFSRQQNNQRTLIFCAFAGEELGLLGSRHFTNGLDAKKVVAVINLEMLGRTGAAGPNGFFLTGTSYSSLPEIFRKALAGQPVKLRKEQYSEHVDLFMRSDNYPFAQLGIAAHTAMSSDDSEPCYHRPCDEWPAINEKHLLQVTNALIKATGTLVAGTERPVVYNIPR